MLWTKLPSGLIVPKDHKALTELGGRSRRGMQDALTMRGHLDIIKVHENGTPWTPRYDDGGRFIPPADWKSRRRDLVYSRRNLIVTLGRESAAQLVGLGGGGASLNKHLGFMAFGRGSGGGATLPLPANTALLIETLRKTVTITFPLTTTVQADAVVASTELIVPPNDVIDEAGLFSADNTSMFTHRTFPTQTHTSAFSFEFRWRIVL